MRVDRREGRRAARRRRARPWQSRTPPAESLLAGGPSTKRLRGQRRPSAGRRRTSIPCARSVIGARPHSASEPARAQPSAARVPYFMLQPREKVRAFLIKYQDRILYATDLVVMPQDDTEKALQAWTSTYERDWKFFATDKMVEYKGHNDRGLRLHEPVLRKLYHDNAVRGNPGIVGCNLT